MKKIDFLINWFYKENQRRVELENSLNIPITILTALIAGLYFFITNFDFTKSTSLNLTFVILIIISVVFWIISITYLIASYNNFFKGYSYKTFPNASFLDVEIRNINDYYSKYKEELDNEKFRPIKQIESNICEFLKGCIDFNCCNNDKKAWYLYKCKLYLILSIISLFLTSLTFSYNNIDNKKIINDEKNTTTTTKTSRTKSC